MEVWTGFVVGLLGSLHCVGMCGPIVAALPQGDSGKMAFLAGRLLYNLGRIVTYAVIGLIFGLIGKTIFMAGYQQGLSIAVGVVIIVAVITPSRYSQGAIAMLGLGTVYSRISRVWGRLFSSKKKSSLFAIGLLNGFLPCGFVYVALAGAVATGGALKGSAYMALFGVGTIPILLAFSFIGNAIGHKFRHAFSRAVPVLAIALALVFILRGLSLGIPILSPKMTQDVATGAVKSSCCDHKATP